MKLPKLNLRDVFWIVVVVAMGLGWLADHRSLANANARWKEASPGFLISELVQFFTDEGYAFRWQNDVLLVKSPNGPSIGISASEVEGLKTRANPDDRRLPF